MRARASNNILNGVEDIIDTELRVKSMGKRQPHYKNKKSCLELKISPLGLDGKAFIKKIYERIEFNHVGSTRKKHSEKNWHFRRKDDFHSEIGPEVRLERTLVKNLGPDWFNQIPTASGLLNERVDKRRAIDLVHRCANGWYEFIELKWRSNTPLFAAMEILQYGLLYILSRQNYKVISGEERKPLLEAQGIQLVVLAPSSYYEYKKKSQKNKYQLAWLESMIKRGLDRFLEDKRRDLNNLQMDFQFQAFPPDFGSNDFAQSQRAAEALRHRKPVYGSMSASG